MCRCPSSDLQVKTWVMMPMVVLQMLLQALLQMMSSCVSVVCACYLNCANDHCQALEVASSVEVLDHAEEANSRLAVEPVDEMAWPKAELVGDHCVSDRSPRKVVPSSSPVEPTVLLVVQTA